MSLQRPLLTLFPEIMLAVVAVIVWVGVIPFAHHTQSVAEKPARDILNTAASAITTDAPSYIFYRIEGCWPGISPSCGHVVLYYAQSAKLPEFQQNLAHDGWQIINAVPKASYTDDRYYQKTISGQAVCISIGQVHEPTLGEQNGQISVEIEINKCMPSPSQAVNDSTLKWNTYDVKPVPEGFTFTLGRISASEPTLKLGYKSNDLYLDINEYDVAAIQATNRTYRFDAPNTCALPGQPVDPGCVALKNSTTPKGVVVYQAKPFTADPSVSDYDAVIHGTFVWIQVRSNNSALSSSAIDTIVDQFFDSLSPTTNQRLKTNYGEKLEATY
jgi:hypothetical protein